MRWFEYLKGMSQRHLWKRYSTHVQVFHPWDEARERKSLGVLPEKIAGGKWSLSKSDAPMTELLKLQPMSSTLS